MSDEKEGDELVRKLAELAKKKESEPPPELTSEVVINLAGMTPLQYAQQLAREAKKYKTPVKLLEKGGADRKRPREHHLRQWYALADLYERAGDIPRARDLFTRVAHLDPDAFDVRDRLRALR